MTGNSVSHPIVGIYCGTGTTCGYLWHAKPLEDKPVNIVFFDEQDLSAKNLDHIDCFCFPSGGGYGKYINNKGQDYLKERVKMGAGFLGTCGGNVFGCSLGLLNAHVKTVGICISGYPEMETQHPKHAAMQSAGEMIYPFYYCDQVFEDVGEKTTTLAVYKRFLDCKTFDGAPYSEDLYSLFLEQPGMVCGNHGKGRVILSGPHPELGEPFLFVDWINYLSQNSSSHDKSVFLPNESDISIKDLLKHINDLYMVMLPFEKELVACFERRWAQGITVGIPILYIMMDIYQRLDECKQCLQGENIFTESILKKLRFCSFSELEGLSSAFKEFIPHYKWFMELITAIETAESYEKEKLKEIFYQRHQEITARLKGIDIPLVRLVLTLKKDKILEQPRTATNSH